MDIERLFKEIEDRRGLEAARELIRAVKIGRAHGESLKPLLELGEEWEKVIALAKSLGPSTIAAEYIKKYGVVRTRFGKKWHLMTKSPNTHNITLCRHDISVFNSVYQHDYPLEGSFCKPCLSSPFLIEKEKWIPEKEFLLRFWLTRRASMLFDGDRVHIGWEKPLCGAMEEPTALTGVLYSDHPISQNVCPECEALISFERFEEDWRQTWTR